MWRGSLHMKMRITKRFLSVAMTILLVFGVAAASAVPAHAATVAWNTSYSAVQKNYNDGSLPAANTSFALGEYYYLNIQGESTVHFSSVKFRVTCNGSSYYNSTVYPIPAVRGGRSQPIFIFFQHRLPCNGRPRA